MASNYTIKSGDTLSGLAKKYNTDIASIMKLNPAVTDPNRIYAGQSLLIPGPEKAPEIVVPVITAAPKINIPTITPPAPPVNATKMSDIDTQNIKIARGDTLSGIAQKNNVSMAELLKFNPQITDPNKIYAGQSLKIPDIIPDIPEITVAPEFKDIFKPLKIGPDMFKKPEELPVLLQPTWKEISANIETEVKPSLWEKVKNTALDVVKKLDVIPEPKEVFNYVKDFVSSQLVKPAIKIMEDEGKRLIKKAKTPNIITHPFPPNLIEDFKKDWKETWSKPREKMTLSNFFYDKKNAGKPTEELKELGSVMKAGIEEWKEIYPDVPTLMKASIPFYSGYKYGIKGEPLISTANLQEKKFSKGYDAAESGVKPDDFISSIGDKVDLETMAGYTEGLKEDLLKLSKDFSKQGIFLTIDPYGYVQPDFIKVDKNGETYIDTSNREKVWKEQLEKLSEALPGFNLDIQKEIDKRVKDSNVAKLTLVNGVTNKLNKIWYLLRNPEVLKDPNSETLKNILAEGIESASYLNAIDPTLETLDVELDRLNRSVSDVEAYYGKEVPLWWKTIENLVGKNVVDLLQKQTEMTDTERETFEDKLLEIGADNTVKLFDALNKLEQAGTFSNIKSNISNILQDPKTIVALRDFFMQSPGEFKPEIEAINKLIETDEWWKRTEVEIKSDLLSRLVGASPTNIGTLREEVLSSRTLKPEQVEAALDWLVWIDDDFKLNDLLMEKMNDIGKATQLLAKLTREDNAVKLQKHKDKMTRIANTPGWKMALFPFNDATFSDWLTSTGLIWKDIIDYKFTGIGITDFEEVKTTDAWGNDHSLWVPTKLGKEKVSLADIGGGIMEKGMEGYDKFLHKYWTPTFLTTLSVVDDLFKSMGDLNSLSDNEAIQKIGDAGTYVHEGLLDLFHLPSEAGNPTGIKLPDSLDLGLIADYWKDTYAYWQNPESYIEINTIDKDTKIEMKDGKVKIGPWTFDQLNSIESLWKLNPHIENIYVLPAGTKLKVPRFAPGPRISDMMDPQDRFKFYSDSPGRAWLIDEMAPLLLIPEGWLAQNAKLMGASLIKQFNVSGLGLTSVDDMLKGAVKGIGGARWAERYSKINEVGEEILRMMTWKGADYSKIPFKVVNRLKIPIDKVRAYVGQTAVLNSLPQEGAQLLSQLSDNIREATNMAGLTLNSANIIRELAERVARDVELSKVTGKIEVPTFLKAQITKDLTSNPNLVFHGSSKFDDIIKSKKLKAGDRSAAKEFVVDDQVAKKIKDKTIFFGEDMGFTMGRIDGRFIFDKKVLEQKFNLSKSPNYNVEKDFITKIGEDIPLSRENGLEGVVIPVVNTDRGTMLGGGVFQDEAHELAAKRFGDKFTTKQAIDIEEELIDKEFSKLLSESLKNAEIEAQKIANEFNVPVFLTESDDAGKILKTVNPLSPEIIVSNSAKKAAQKELDRMLNVSLFDTQMKPEDIVIEVFKANGHTTFDLFEWAQKRSFLEDPIEALHKTAMSPEWEFMQKAFNSRLQKLGPKGDNFFRAVWKDGSLPIEEKTIKNAADLDAFKNEYLLGFKGTDMYQEVKVQIDEAMRLLREYEGFTDAMRTHGQNAKVLTRLPSGLEVIIPDPDNKELLGLAGKILPDENGGWKYIFDPAKFKKREGEMLGDAMSQIFDIRLSDSKDIPYANVGNKLQYTEKVTESKTLYHRLVNGVSTSDSKTMDNWIDLLGKDEVKKLAKEGNLKFNTTSESVGFYQQFVNDELAGPLKSLRDWNNDLGPTAVAKLLKENIDGAKKGLKKGLELVDTKTQNFKETIDFSDTQKMIKTKAINTINLYDAFETDIYQNFLSRKDEGMGEIRKLLKTISPDKLTEEVKVISRKTIDWGDKRTVSKKYSRGGIIQGDTADGLGLWEGVVQKVKRTLPYSHESIELLLKRAAYLDFLKGTDSGRKFLTIHKNRLKATARLFSTNESKMDTLLIETFGMKPILPTFSHLLLLEDKLLPSQTALIKKTLEAFAENAKININKALKKLWAKEGKTEKIESYKELLEDKFLYPEISNMQDKIKIGYKEGAIDTIIPAIYNYIPKAKISEELIQSGYEAVAEESIELARQTLAKVADAKGTEEMVIAYRDLSKIKLPWSVEDIKSRMLTPIKKTEVSVGELRKEVTSSNVYDYANPNGALTVDDVINLMTTVPKDRTTMGKGGKALWKEAEDRWNASLVRALQNTPEGRRITKEYGLNGAIKDIMNRERGGITEEGLNEKLRELFFEGKLGEDSYFSSILSEAIEKVPQDLFDSYRSNIDALSTQMKALRLDASTNAKTGKKTWIRKIKIEDANEFALRTMAKKLDKDAAKYVDELAAAKIKTPEIVQETLRDFSNFFAMDTFANSTGSKKYIKELGKVRQLQDTEILLAAKIDLIDEKILKIQKSILSKSTGKETERFLARSSEELKKLFFSNSGFDDLIKEAKKLEDEIAKLKTAKKVVPDFLSNKLASVNRKIDTLEELSKTIPQKTRELKTLRAERVGVYKELEKTNTALAGYDNTLPGILVSAGDINTPLSSLKSKAADIISGKSILTKRVYDQIENRLEALMLSKRSITKHLKNPDLSKLQDPSELPILRRLKKILGESSGIKGLSIKDDNVINLKRALANINNEISDIEKFKDSYNKFKKLENAGLKISWDEMQEFGRGKTLKSLEDKFTKLDTALSGKIKSIPTELSSAVDKLQLSSRSKEILNIFEETQDDLKKIVIKDAPTDEILDSYLPKDILSKSYVLPRLRPVEAPQGTENVLDMIDTLSDKGTKVIVDLTGSLTEKAFRGYKPSVKIVQLTNLSDNVLPSLSKLGDIPSKKEVDGMVELRKIFIEDRNVAIWSGDYNKAKLIADKLTNVYLGETRHNALRAAQDVIFGRDKLTKRTQFSDATFRAPRRDTDYIEIFGSPTKVAIKTTEALAPEKAISQMYKKVHIDVALKDVELALRSNDLMQPGMYRLGDSNFRLPTLIIAPDLENISTPNLNKLKVAYNKQGAKFFLPKDLTKGEELISEYLTAEKIPFERMTIDLDSRIIWDPSRDYFKAEKYPVSVFNFGDKFGPARANMMAAARREHRLFKSKEEWNKELLKVFMDNVNGHFDVNKVTGEKVFVKGWLQDTSKFVPKFIAAEEMSLMKQPKKLFAMWKRFQNRDLAKANWEAGTNRAINKMEVQMKAELLGLSGKKVLTESQIREIAKQKARWINTKDLMDNVFDWDKKPTWYELVEKKLNESLEMRYFQDRDLWGLAGYPMGGFNKLKFSTGFIEELLKGVHRLPQIKRALLTPAGWIKTVWLKSVLYWRVGWYIKNAYGDSVRGAMAAQNSDYFLKSMSMYGAATASFIRKFAGDISKLPSAVNTPLPGQVDELAELIGGKSGRKVASDYSFSLRKAKSAPYDIWNPQIASQVKKKGVGSFIDRFTWEKSGLNNLMKWEDMIEKGPMLTPKGEYLSKDMLDFLSEAGIFQVTSDPVFQRKYVSMLPENTMFQRLKKRLYVLDADLQVFANFSEITRRHLLVNDLLFKKAMTLAQAKAKTWGYLFNYRDLSIVGKTFRNIFPFYAFNSKTLALFINTVGSSPKRLAAARALLISWSAATEELPEYNRGKIPIPGTGLLWMPWFSWAQIMSFFKDPMQNLKEFAENPLRVPLGFGLDPYWTSLIQIATKKKYFDLSMDIKSATGWSDADIDNFITSQNLKRDISNDWFSLVLNFIPTVNLVKTLSEVDSYMLADGLSILNSKKLREWMKFFGFNISSWTDFNKFMQVYFDAPNIWKSQVRKELIAEDPDVWENVEKYLAKSTFLKAMEEGKKDPVKAMADLQLNSTWTVYHTLENNKKGSGKIWLEKLKKNNPEMKKALEEFYEKKAKESETTPWDMWRTAQFNRDLLASDMRILVDKVFTKDVIGKTEIMGIPIPFAITGDKTEFRELFFDKRGNLRISSQEELEKIFGREWTDKVINNTKKTWQEYIKDVAEVRYAEYLYMSTQAETPEDKAYWQRMARWQSILPSNLDTLTDKETEKYWSPYWDYFEKYFTKEQKAQYYTSMKDKKGEWYYEYRVKMKEYVSTWAGLHKNLDEESDEFFDKFYATPEWFRNIYFLGNPNRKVWYPFARTWINKLRDIDRIEKKTGVYQSDMRKAASKYFWDNEAIVKNYWDKDNKGFYDYMKMWKDIMVETETNPEDYFPKFYAKPDWFRSRFFKRNPDKAVYYPFVFKWTSLIAKDTKNKENGKETNFASDYFWSDANKKFREAYGKSKIISGDHSILEYLKTWKDLIDYTKKNPGDYYSQFDKQAQWFKDYYFKKYPMKEKEYSFNMKMQAMTPEERTKFFLDPKNKEIIDEMKKTDPEKVDLMYFWAKLGNYASLNQWNLYFKEYFAAHNAGYRATHEKNNPGANKRFRAMYDYGNLPAITWEDKRARRDFLKKNPELIEWWNRDVSATEAELKKTVEGYYALLDNIPATGQGRSYFLRVKEWNLKAEQYLLDNPEVVLFWQRQPRTYIGEKALMQGLAETYSAFSTMKEKQDYLKDHPELKEYFRSLNPPGIRDIQKVQDIYFTLSDTHKTAYLGLHPELLDYWEINKLPLSYFTDPTVWKEMENLASKVDKAFTEYGSGNWTTAETLREGLSSVYKNPGDSPEAEWFKTKIYAKAMKTWGQMIERNDTQAIYFFRQLPDWIRTMYYIKHPEKKILSKEPLSRFLEEPIRIYQNTYPDFAWADKIGQVYGTQIPAKFKKRYLRILRRYEAWDYYDWTKSTNSELSWANKVKKQYGRNMSQEMFKKYRGILVKYGVWQSRENWSKADWKSYWDQRTLTLNNISEYDFNTIPLLRKELKRVQERYPLNVPTNMFKVPSVGVIDPFFIFLFIAVSVNLFL